MSAATRMQALEHSAREIRAEEYQKKLEYHVKHAVIAHRNLEKFPQDQAHAALDYHLSQLAFLVDL